MTLKELINVADNFDIIRLYHVNKDKFICREFKRYLITNYYYLLDYEVVKFRCEYNLNFGSELIITIDYINIINKG